MLAASWKVCAILALMAFGACQGCLKNPVVDRVVLATTWLPGFCTTNKGSCQNFRITPEFKIHGLWPNGPSRKVAQCCSNQEWTQRKLDTMKTELANYWMMMDNNAGLVKYQWEKHGTCAGGIRGIETMQKYFRFAVDEFRGLDMKKVLVAFGIKPSNKVEYRAHDIERALYNHYGVKAQLECSAKNQAMVLTGVRFCYDELLQVVNCARTREACSKSLLFPESAV